MATLATLKTNLLPLVDKLRGIPAELGFRPYQVWARLTTWSGEPRPGTGTKTITDTRLLVNGLDPKVREARRKDVITGSYELIDGQWDIGPLTPSFAGGGVAYATIKPPNDGTGAEVNFLIKGDGMPAEGLLCKRVSDHTDHSLRYMVRVQSVGRKPSAT